MCVLDWLSLAAWWAIITVQYKRVTLFYLNICYHSTVQHTQQRDTFQQSSSFQPSSSFQQCSTLFQCLLECICFLVYHFSQNHRATVARPSRDSRTTDARRMWERREAVDGNKCSQFHRVSIVRVSRECRANVVKHSPMIRATIVQHSCDYRKFVLFTYSVWPQCDYGCNVVFLSPKRVSN